MAEMYGMDSAKRFLSDNLEKPQDEYMTESVGGSTSLEGKSMNKSYMDHEKEEEMEDM